MTLGPESTQSLVETLCLIMGFISVATGSYLIQKAWYREVDTAEAIMATIVFAFGWVVVSGQLLGAFGISSLTTRLLADALYVSIALLSYTKYFPEKKGVSKTRASVGSPTLVLLLISGMIVAIAVWVWAWVSPPPPWDAFVYHLSFPASWVKSGSIFPVTVPFGDQAGTYFPSNVEMIFFWLLTYSRQDFTTNCVQCFFLLQCVLAVFRLCRISGADRSPSLCAAFAVFFMPSMLHQAAASEVDVAFSAMFISCLYFLIRWIKAPDTRMNMIMAFISAGLFLGSKTIAIPWTVVILIPVLLYAIYKHGFKLWMFIGIACSILTGGFWYIRNLLLTGNPLFPLTLKIGSFTLLNGAYERSSVLHSAFHTDSFAEWAALMANCWGIPIIITLAAMSIFAMFSSVSIRKKIFFPAVSLTILFLSFFVIPYNREVRFTYTAFLVALIPLSLFINIWRKKNRMYMYLIFLAIYICNVMLIINGNTMFHRQLIFHLYNIVTAAHPVYKAMIPGAITMAAAAITLGGVIFFYVVTQKWNNKMSAVVLVGLALIFVSTFVESKRYEKYRYQYYSFFLMGRSWDALHQLVPESARVSYTGTDLSYGLFGPMLKNTVYYTSINKHGFKYFHQCNKYVKNSGTYVLPKTDRIDFCRREPSYDMWRDKLVSLETDILYVTILHQNDRPHIWHDEELFPIERSWADDHKDMFNLIYRNPQVRIYQVFH